MPQTDYVISTTALSLTPSGTTVVSANTQAGSFTLSRTLTRSGLGADELDGSSQTWSIHYVVSATTGLCASRFRLKRLDSGGGLQATSGYFTAHEPIATGTYDEDVTWASGAWAANDQLVLEWETYRTSGTGNKTATIDANGGSYVTAPVAAQTYTKAGFAVVGMVGSGVSEFVSGASGNTYVETGVGIIG